MENVIYCGCLMFFSMKHVCSLSSFYICISFNEIETILHIISASASCLILRLKNYMLETVIDYDCLMFFSMKHVCSLSSFYVYIGFSETETREVSMVVLRKMRWDIFVNAFSFKRPNICPYVLSNARFDCRIL